MLRFILVVNMKIIKVEYLRQKNEIRNMNNCAIAMTGQSSFEKYDINKEIFN